VSITPFLVDAFSAALDRGIASAQDMIRHLTPDVLAVHLPRPLWARLLTACLGAARVDATTIVDTVGIANLCEHLPKPLLWACLSEIAATAMGGAKPVAPQIAVNASSSGEVLLPPPPAAASRPGSNPGEAEPVASLFDGRSRTPTRPPGRSNLGTNRISTPAGASTRRPQVPAPAPAPTPPSPSTFSGVRLPTPAAVPRSTRRDDLDFEIETDIRSDWKGKDPIPVDDEQLVEWSPNEETTDGSNIDGTKR
jgi:hypothetical protein